MHAILLLPFLAWLLSLTDWNEQRQLRVVRLATAGYFVLTGVIAVWNLAGLEPRRMPIVAVGIAAAGMLALVAAAVIAVIGVARSAPFARFRFRAEPHHLSTG